MTNIRTNVASAVLLVILVDVVGSAQVAAPATPATGSTRIKDIASLQRTPPIPLIGYGLVIGLNKTGDRK